MDKEQNQILKASKIIQSTPIQIHNSSNCSLKIQRALDWYNQ